LKYYSEQVGQLQQELLSTKELYLDVCKSKDVLESEVQYLKKDLAHQQVFGIMSSFAVYIEIMQ